MKRLSSILTVLVAIAGLSAGGLWGQTRPSTWPRPSTWLSARFGQHQLSARRAAGDLQGTCQSHTDCSGFIDALLMHSYGTRRTTSSGGSARTAQRQAVSATRLPGSGASARSGNWPTFSPATSWR